MRTVSRPFGYAHCATCPQRSASLMLERAEGRLPPVEAVIESLHALVAGPLLQCLADFEHPVHASRVPGSCELVERLLGVLAGGLGVSVGSFDGRQVAEDHGPLLVVGGWGGL